MRYRSPFRPVVLLLAISWPQVARSDPEAMVAPRLIHDPGAAYPTTALAEHYYEPAEVVVILEIGPTGTVASVQLENPVGHGFDEAAEQSARQLRFEPALRDGQPIASRIKFRYTFTVPAPSLFGRVVDAVSGVPLAGARLLLTVSEGGITEIVSDADGNFSLADAPRGAAQLSVHADGSVDQETSVVFVPGDETRVTFRLDPIVVMQPSEATPSVER
jgi:TonB family protein